MNEQHLCDFLAGRKGLSTSSTMRLLQLINANKVELQAKLSGKTSGSQIAHFQSEGKPMRLSNEGWIAREGDSAADPNNWGDDITSVNNNPARTVPDQDELEFLAGLAGLHQKIIDKINNWQAQQKAKPNANGSTGPARQISRPKTPGPRGDLL